MRKRLALLGVATVVFSAITPAFSQEKPADPDKTYDIKAKYSVGDLLKYQMNMNLNMAMTVPNGASPFPGGEMVMTSGLKYKTVGIKPDGTAVITIQTEGAKGTMMGQEMPVPATPPITMEVDSRGIGKMRGMENVPGGQVLSQLMNMNKMPSMGLALPDHPVKIGESWDVEIPSPMGKIKMASTLLGVERLGGVETLRIKMITTMPLDFKMGAAGTPVTDDAKAMMIMSGNSVTSSILNIQSDNARILKLAGDIKTDMKMTMKGEAASQSPFGSEMNMKMDGKMSLNLLSAGKVPATPVKPPVKADKKG